MENIQSEANNESSDIKLAQMSTSGHSRPLSDIKTSETETELPEEAQIIVNRLNRSYGTATDDIVELVNILRKYGYNDKMIKKAILANVHFVSRTTIYNVLPAELKRGYETKPKLEKPDVHIMKGKELVNEFREIENKRQEQVISSPEQIPSFQPANYDNKQQEDDNEALTDLEVDFKKLDNYKPHIYKEYYGVELFKDMYRIIDRQKRYRVIIQEY